MKLTIKKLITASVLTVAMGGVAHADTFTGDGDGSSWHDPANWDNGVPSASANIVVVQNDDILFNGATWTYLTTNSLLTGGATGEYRGAGRLLMGESNAGADNGTHSLTMDQGGSNYVRMTNSGGGGLGLRNGKNSTLNIVSGITNFEHGTFTLGSQALGTGTVNLSGGEMILGRAGLVVGGDGTGTINITGGAFSNRGTAAIGALGTFHVAGSNAAQVGIGSEGSVDGSWDQAAGGMLRIGLDAGGSSLILIDDYLDDGGGTQGNATFASGAILEPYDFGGAVTDVWTTVMTWEGALTDNGLALSSAASSAGWQMQVAGSSLQVQLVSVPEPSSLALLAFGSLAMVRRRRK